MALEDELLRQGPGAGRVSADVALRLRRLSPEGRRAVLAKLDSRREEVVRVALMSHAQQRLWFLEKLAGGNPYYNETSAIRLLFAVDPEALRRSLNDVVERHEALRTVFDQVDGEPQQRVLRRLPVDVPVLDLSGCASDDRDRRALDAAQRQGLRPFDLATGPLLRATLLRNGPADFVLVFTMHHIVCDGWSMRLFFDELQACYEARATGRPPALTPLPIQYADYAEWQRGRLSPSVLDRQLEYWREQLADVPPLELPLDFARPAVPTFGGGRVPVALSADAYAAVRRLCDEERATPFMGLLAAFQVLLHRYTGQDDIAVGSPVAGRSRPEDERLIGFFVNTVVLRGDLSGEPSFRQAVRRIRDAALSAFEHQDVPFERVVEELRPERDPSRNPLFQVTFQMLRAPATSPAGSSGLSRSLDVDLHTSKFDLRCDLWEDAGGGVRGYLEYSTDLFRAERAAAMARHLETLAGAAAAAPDERIGRLELLAPDDVRQVTVDWNRTAAEPPAFACAHQAFERWAARTPSAAAVDDGRSSLTYGELNRQANRLARHLHRRGVIPGSLVAILADRSVEYVLAIVAAAKAGAAYVPLDPSYPDERLAATVRDAGVQLVLTTGVSWRKAPPGIEGLRVDVDRARWADETPDDLPAQVDARSLAYVVFTSGSTGRPKGVEVLHGGLANLVAWHDAEYQVTAADRATLYASPAFDASVWEMWPYLAAGASLWIPDERAHRSPGDLLSWMAHRGVTLAFLPTPVAEDVVERELPPALRLRALLTGGDRLRRPPRRPLPFRFVNHYGPTEATVVATSAPVPREPGEEPPPIGRPIANMKAYVLDRYLRPVPAGVKGELYLAGHGLARGYLNDASLTRERFVPDPFQGRSGSRMYRTGDVVRHRFDGSLEFHGRVDRQLKIRGFRVEPQDVETVLDEHPSVASSVVVPVDTAGGDAALAAYVVPRCGGPEPPAAEAQAERTREWRRIYDGIYGDPAAVRKMAPDLVGWNSSYSGGPIPEPEMREQVQATVRRIAALGGRRILEIGCGTGLLLFGLAEACDRYVATDFSEAGVNALAAECALRGLRHVDVLCAEADEAAPAGEEPFDVVVLNSVIQYFPGLDYLERVLAAAARALRPGGRLFVGDVRNRRLLSWLHAGVELAHAADQTTAEELRDLVARRVEGEQELVVDPRFFTAWAGAQPQGGGLHVEVRRGHHHNEITKFRYDAVITVGARMEALTDWEEHRWEERDGTAAWEAHLRATEPGALVLRDVPSARLAAERRLLEMLQAADSRTTVAELRRELASAGGGADPEDLWSMRLGPDRGIHVGWSAAGAEGCYDVWCVPGCAGGRFLPEDRQLPAEPADEPAAAYVNDVLRPTLEDLRTRELRDHLRRRLPAHMVPSEFVWSDRLPVTTNGKLDRRSLPPARERAQRPAGSAAPRDQVEERIASIWSEVLGLEHVGAETNFFDLGGHSLLLVKVHRRLNDALRADFSMVELFEHPTVRSLAEAVSARAGRTPASTATQDPTHDRRSA